MREVDFLSFRKVIYLVEIYPFFLVKDNTTTAFPLETKSIYEMIIKTLLL